MIAEETHMAAIAALQREHREELAAERALLLRFRETLEEHGIEPPTIDGRAALARFRHVFEIAGHLDKIQHPELLADWRAQREAEEASAA